jgi:hypothetical protein
VTLWSPSSKAKKAGSHAGHAYGWAKKYAVVMLGEQPVLVFKDKAPVGEEAAGGNTPRRPRLKRVSHHRAQPLRICTQCIWLAFTARARAFQHRASAKFDKSIPGWAVLLLAET